MISVEQMKAARMLADLSQRQLAEMSGLSLPTIQRMESATHGPGKSSAENLGKVIEALGAAGVIFLDPTAQHGPGVALALHKDKKSSKV